MIRPKYSSVALLSFALGGCGPSVENGTEAWSESGEEPTAEVHEAVNTIRKGPVAAAMTVRGSVTGGEEIWMFACDANHDLVWMKFAGGTPIAGPYAISDCQGTPTVEKWIGTDTDYGIVFLNDIDGDFWEFDWPDTAGSDDGFWYDISPVPGVGAIVGSPVVTAVRDYTQEMSIAYTRASDHCVYTVDWSGGQYTAHRVKEGTGCVTSSYGNDINAWPHGGVYLGVGDDQHSRIASRAALDFTHSYVGQASSLLSVTGSTGNAFGLDSDLWLRRGIVGVSVNATWKPCGGRGMPATRRSTQIGGWVRGANAEIEEFFTTSSSCTNRGGSVWSGLSSDDKDQLVFYKGSDGLLKYYNVSTHVHASTIVLLP